jgi:membrane protease YdiL (CAAX protease family)
MNSHLEDDGNRGHAAFRDATWKTGWIFAGLAMLALWRSSSLLDEEVAAGVPLWAWLIFGSILPQLFLLLFPILTRRPLGEKSWRFPTLPRIIREFTVAIPLTALLIALLVLANYLVSLIWPGRTLVPDAIVDLARSLDFRLLAGGLAFTFVFVPVAEEVFFRGFLHNALRARLPVKVAVLLQCAVFAASHSFGWKHGVVAFLVGLGLTAVYEWRKTLVTPILVHAGINFISAISIAAMAIAFTRSPQLGVLCSDGPQGCDVYGIEQDSAAEAAGIQAGDTITAFDGTPTPDFRSLVLEISQHVLGERPVVTVIRNKTTIDVPVELKERVRPGGN